MPASDTGTQRCGYQSPDWPCPFDAEPGADRCIFHLPMDKKRPEDFWRHLASYVKALLDKTGTKETSEWQKAHPGHWVLAEAESALVAHYSEHVQPGEPWRFTGFVFPAMDADHNFAGFVFPAADFSRAQFSAEADFGDARFNAAANFGGAQFSAAAYFWDARFNAAANFGGAQFSAAAYFWYAQFSAKANFGGAQFSAKANFGGAQFSAAAYFLGTQFSDTANFEGAQFSAAANFWDAQFSAEANFWYAQFSGEASFSGAQFSGELTFENGSFGGDATDFSRARFSGAVLFRRTTMNTLLILRYAHLRNQMLFDGTRMENRSKVLLWGLNFVHGTSDITLGNGGEKGRIIEPAGQVVFRDISEGMNRVSFLHTDILTDRLLVRFSNVKWETDPKKFLFDAAFSFSAPTKWQKATGLPEDEINRLPELFLADRPAPEKETPEQKAAQQAEALRDCKPLVRQDVERIAREIRLSHEKYGNYSDAGDYYIAEMAYRERTTRWSKPFVKAGLCLYGLLSRYGESPGRALLSLLTGLLLFGCGYVLTGFKFMGRTVAREPRFVLSQFGPTVSDLWLALRMALTNLLPGNLRADALGLEFLSRATMTLAVFQVVTTYILLTLFLLAIRRRFRR